MSNLIVLFVCISQDTQFERILDQLLGTHLSHDEIDQLCLKYDTKQNSMVNYRNFLTTVNQSKIAF